MFGEMKKKRQISGLTLVEIAIVLVILGLLVGLGASLIGPLTKRAKLTESREIVKQAKEALFGYAIKFRYLPESSKLGDAGAKSRDSWGRDLVYIPAQEITGSDINLCNVYSTSLVVRECKDTDCSTYDEKKDIALVIYSKGEDGDGNCTGTTSPVYIREIGMPYNPTCTYTTSNPQFYYDDIVEYVSLNEIASRTCTYSQPIPPSTGLCSGGNCTNNCQITFKNTSSDNNIWIKGGNVDCQKLQKNEEKILTINSGEKIYIYDAHCNSGHLLDTLTLANPIKSPATIEWSGKDSVICK